MTSAEFDVAIVGARCAGAPLAMLLARQGHSVVIIERVEMPSDTMSTHWVLRRGVESLVRWGLLDGLVETGCPPIARVSLDFGEGCLVGSPGPTAMGPAITYAPRRYILDGLLLDAARSAGAQVRTGTWVRDVLRRDGRVCGVIGHDTEDRPFEFGARVVVGADGRNSTIAKAVGSEVTHDRGVLAATAYGYWSGLDVSGVEVYFSDRLGISMWPTHDQLTVVAVTFPRSVLEEGWPSAEGGYLRLLGRTRAVGKRLSAGTLASPVRAATNLRNFYRVSHGPGWALAGDAGHHKDPIGASGISDAFHDAANLANEIHNGLAGMVPMDRALARYQARRNASRAAMFEFTCRQAALSPTGGEFDQVLRAAQHDSAVAAELLGVFVGSRTVESVFAPHNLALLLGNDGASVH